MKDYVVSYYLGDFYHSYTIEAENEARAIQEVIDTMPDGSKAIFHSFKIIRKKENW